MCNLSQGIREKGRAEGRAEGEIGVVLNMYHKLSQALLHSASGQFFPMPGSCLIRNCNNPPAVYPDSPPAGQDTPV